MWARVAQLAMRGTAIPKRKVGEIKEGKRRGESFFIFWPPMMANEREKEDDAGVNRGSCYQLVLIH